MQITAEMHNEALVLIEDMCLMITNKFLTQLGMTSPNRTMHAEFNQGIQREQQYDCDELNEYVLRNVPKMRKTFVISLLLAALRSRHQITLALASSGIAATLLDGGRTAHSALKLPLNMQIIENPTCNISNTSGMAKLPTQCKMIVWDECTMAHKSLEALDRTLQDLRGNHTPFGGALILLAGDFRQTLPVIPRSTAADEINACLKSSNFWRHVKTLQLTANMRVQLQNDQIVGHWKWQNDG
ncbi:uncharacterized protein DMENIID0001_003780 [Sergentomyia squamirostris]